MSERTIDTATVEKVARLARIDLSPAERDSLAVELRKILRFVAQLQAVDTTDVAPLIHTTSEAMPLRDDRVGEPLSAAATMANAPQHTGDCFVVPRVVGG